jgi:uncharacterized integral membrane protein
MIGVIEEGDSSMVQRSERRRGTSLKAIAIGLLVLAVVIVILQNRDDASLDVLMFNVTWPLWLLLTAVAVLSFVAGWFSGRTRG